MTPGEHVEGRKFGKAYALFAMAFAFFAIVIAIVAQVGLADRLIAFLVIFVTLATYAVIGVVTRTLSFAEFTIAARKVPAGLNGMATAVALLSTAGIIGLVGAFFAGGADALAIVIGWLTGFVVLAVLVAPYYRKSGAVTVPDFLAVRFGNPLLRIFAVLILLAAMVPLLVAALAIGAFLVAAVLGFDLPMAMAIILVVLLLSSLLGGMRSVTFVAGAQAIVVLFGILVPAALYSTEHYGLPLAQLSYGSALEELGAISDTLLTTSASRILPLPGSDWFNLLAIAVAFAAAVASMPHVLGRSATTAGVGGARRSVGWALLVVFVVVVTAPAIAAFARLAMLQGVVGAAVDDLPQWVFDLGRLGLTKLCGVSATAPEAVEAACARSGAGSFEISADGVALAFADIAELPYVASALIAASAIAAALAGAGAALIAIANSLGNDIYSRFIDRRASAGRRLLVARIALIGAVAGAAWLAMNYGSESLAAATLVPTIAASGLFPAIFLGIWWRRTTFWGALAGMLIGFAAAAAYAIFVQFGGMVPWRVAGLTGALAPGAAAILGLPAGFAAAILVSYATPRPSAVRLKVIDAIRRPGHDPILEDHAA